MNFLQIVYKLTVIIWFLCLENGAEREKEKKQILNIEQLRKETACGHNTNG